MPRPNDMMECLDVVTASCIVEMFQNILFVDRILKQTGRVDGEKGECLKLYSALWGPTMG